MSQQSFNRAIVDPGRGRVGPRTNPQDQSPSRSGVHPAKLALFTNVGEDNGSEVRTGLCGVAPCLRWKRWPASPKQEEGGREMAQLMRRYPLVTFFLLVYSITWVV